MALPMYRECCIVSYFSIQSLTPGLSLETYRNWNKEWQIPLRPRLRQPRFDAETIRPHFEELYEQQHSLDQIVFILYDRLGVPVTFVT